MGHSRSVPCPTSTCGNGQGPGNSHIGHDAVHAVPSTMPFGRIHLPGTRWMGPGDGPMNKQTRISAAQLRSLKHRTFVSGLHKTVPSDSHHCAGSAGDSVLGCTTRITYSAVDDDAGGRKELAKFHARPHLFTYIIHAELMKPAMPPPSRLGTSCPEVQWGTGMGSRRPNLQQAHPGPPSRTSFSAQQGQYVLQ